MDEVRHTGISRPRPGAVLVVLLVLALVTGCESREAQAVKVRQAALRQPLSALADQGEVEAMRVVADIEVLRAQSMFSDSAANALTAMPGTAFISLDPKGQPTRIERGQDLTQLLAFTSAEPGLLKGGPNFQYVIMPVNLQSAG